MEKTKNNITLGVILVAIGAILRGLDAVAFTPKLYNLYVPFVVFMLHAIPASIMTIFNFKYWGKLLHYEFKEVISLVVVAFLGGAVGTICIVKSLFLVNFDHLSVVVIIQKLQPIFAILLAMLFLKEKTKKNFWLWTTIAFIGCYFLTFELNMPSFSGDNNLIKAAMYALLAAFSFSCGTVFSKSALTKIPFKEAAYFRFSFTAILVGIYLAISGGFVWFSHITPVNWLYFGIIAVTSGYTAMLIYYSGLKKIKASVSTIVELLFPISSIVFDYFINGSKLSIVQIVASVLILFSIIKISKLK